MGVGEWLWQGAKSFGKTIYYGGRHFTRAWGMHGAGESIQAGEDQKRVWNSLKTLGGNVSGVTKGLIHVVDFMVESGMASDPQLRQLTAQVAKRAARGAAKSQAVHALIVKQVGKAVSKALLKAVLSKIAIQVTKQISTKVAAAAATSGTGVGIPIGALQAAGLIEMAAVGSKSLQKAYPKLYGKLKPLGVDLAWYWIEPMIPSLMVTVKRAIIAELGKRLGQAAPATH